MYDVTAWSFPCSMGSGCCCTGRIEGKLRGDRAGIRTKRQGDGESAALAYLVPWGLSSSARFLAGALQEGCGVATTDKSFAQGGKTYPSGTLIIKVQGEPRECRRHGGKACSLCGAEVFGTDTGWMEEGPNFGSRYVSYFPATLKIALAWDRPTGAQFGGCDSLSCWSGDIGYPVTVVRTAQLGTGDLSQFQVIVLPDGGFGEGYEAGAGSEWRRRLRDWVQGGGTLVAMGPAAVSYLASPASGMLAITQENVARDAEQPARTGGAATPAAATGPLPARSPGKLLASEKDFEKATQPDTELLIRCMASCCARR